MSHRLVALFVAMSVGLCGCRRPAGHASPSATATPLPPEPPPVPPPPAGTRTQDETNTIAVFRADAPSAVFVTQQQLVVDPFAGRAMEVPSGSGSGFVWDTDGHVVTNFHVVQNAKALTVTLQNQHTYPATVVGVEPRKDIAVIHVEGAPPGLRPIPRPPRAPTLEVGQKVIAIGNPFGLDHTLTTGIVSALGREVEGIGGVTIRDMIQTDAAINPGNSGGPLLDSSGRLIGMNTMILSRSGAWAGIGFAVPIETILRIVPQLIKLGHVEQVGIGVRIDPQRRVERRLGIRGVVVLSVIPGSPADRAGVHGVTRTFDGFALGDVITGINGKPVRDYDDLYNLLDGKKPGERVKVRLQGGDTTREVELPLEVVE